jgi:hypothetical protein
MSVKAENRLSLQEWRAVTESLIRLAVESVKVKEAERPSRSSAHKD